MSNWYCVKSETGLLQGEYRESPPGVDLSLLVIYPSRDALRAAKKVQTDQNQADIPPKELDEPEVPVSPGVKRILLSMTAHCVGCRTTIQDGNEVHWVRGLGEGAGFYHLDCPIDPKVLQRIERAKT
ncbi:MAG: hypothetical protein WC824_09520 [Bacteroidota bacterium]|jgi:hypothetical protein